MKELRKCDKIIEANISYLNELRFYRDYEVRVIERAESTK